MNDGINSPSGEQTKLRKASAPDPLLNCHETQSEREPQIPATPEAIRKQIAMRRQSLNRDKSILELLRDRGQGTEDGDDEDDSANTESSYDASSSFEASPTPRTSCLPCLRIWSSKNGNASSKSHGSKSGVKAASIVESVVGQATAAAEGDDATAEDANASTPTGWEAAKRATHSVNFVQKLKSGKQTDAHARLRGYLAFVPAMLINQLDSVSATAAATAAATRPIKQNEHGFNGNSNKHSTKPTMLRGSMAVAPSLERRQGVVFFADLSGFTKLTEKLAVHPHGAELLCAALDQVYALLLGAANQWGGDAVKFAGDAILFCWTVSDDDEDKSNDGLRLCCERAIRCSDLVHQLIKAHPPVAGVQLTLHAGLCVGPLACCVLGGATLQPRRFEFVVCGPPLAQLAVAEPAAKPGETVLSPEAAALVTGSGLCRFEPIQSPDPAAGYFRLKGLLPEAPTTPQPVLPLAAATFQQLEPRHLAVMEPFIPRHITRTLDDKSSARHLLAGESDTVGGSSSSSSSSSDGGASKAEVRELTVLFASVQGVDLAANLHLSQAVFGAVQRGIYTFGGSVNKLLVDDKGTSVVALFGLPPLVHADAPARAIAAAFLINELLGKLSTTTPAAGAPQPHGDETATTGRQQGLAARVGITTARTFCGVVGAPHRREFTVMGDSVNLAARLMAACGDVVLPSELFSHVPQGPRTSLSSRSGANRGSSNSNNSMSTSSSSQEDFVHTALSAVYEPMHSSNEPQSSSSQNIDCQSGSACWRPRVLVDLATAAACSRHVNCAQLPDLRVKGKSKAVAVFHPTRFFTALEDDGERAASSQESQLFLSKVADKIIPSKSNTSSHEIGGSNTHVDWHRSASSLSNSSSFDEPSTAYGFLPSEAEAEATFIGRGPRQQRAALDTALASLASQIHPAAANTPSASTTNSNTSSIGTVAVVSGEEGCGKHRLASWLPVLAPKHSLCVCGPTPATRAQNLFEDGRLNEGTVFTAFRGPILSMLHALEEANLLTLATGAEKKEEAKAGENLEGREAVHQEPLSPSALSSSSLEPFSPQAHAEARGEGPGYVTSRRRPRQPGSSQSSSSSSSIGGSGQRRTFGMLADAVDVLACVKTLDLPQPLHEDFPLLRFVFPDRPVLVAACLGAEQQQQSYSQRQSDGFDQNDGSDYGDKDEDSRDKHPGLAIHRGSRGSHTSSHASFNLPETGTAELHYAALPAPVVLRLTRLLVAIITAADALLHSTGSGDTSDTTAITTTSTDRNATRSLPRLLLVLEHCERLMDPESWALVNALRLVTSGRRKGARASGTNASGSVDKAGNESKSKSRSKTYRDGVKVRSDSDGRSNSSSYSSSLLTAGSLEDAVTEFAAAGAAPKLLLVTRPLVGLAAPAEYHEAAAEATSRNAYIEVIPFHASDSTAFLNYAASQTVVALTRAASRGGLLGETYQKPSERETSYSKFVRAGDGGDGSSSMRVTRAVASLASAAVAQAAPLPEEGARLLSLAVAAMQRGLHQYCSGEERPEGKEGEEGDGPNSSDIRVSSDGRSHDEIGAADNAIVVSPEVSRFVMERCEGRALLCLELISDLFNARALELTAIPSSSSSSSSLYSATTGKPSNIDEKSMTTATTATIASPSTTTKFVVEVRQGTSLDNLPLSHQLRLRALGRFHAAMGDDTSADWLLLARLASAFQGAFTATMLARVAAHVHGDVDLNAFDQHHNHLEQQPLPGVNQRNPESEFATLDRNITSSSTTSTTNSSSKSSGANRKSVGEGRAKRRLSGVAAAQADALQALEVTQHLNSSNYVTVPRRSSLFSSRAYDDDDELDEDDNDSGSGNEEIHNAVLLGNESNGSETSAMGPLSAPNQSPSGSSTDLNQSNRRKLPAPRPLPNKVESRVAQALRALDKDHGILEACAHVDPWLPTSSSSGDHLYEHDNNHNNNNNSECSGLAAPGAVAYRFRSQLVARALRDTLLHAQVAAVGAALLEFQDDQVVEQCASAPVRKLLFGDQNSAVGAAPAPGTTTVSSPANSAFFNSPSSSSNRSSGNRSNAKDVRRLAPHKENERKPNLSSKPNAQVRASQTKSKSARRDASDTVAEVYTCSAGPLLRTAAAAAGGALPHPPQVRKPLAAPPHSSTRGGPPSAQPHLQQQRRPGYVHTNRGGGGTGPGASSLREARSASERRAPSPSRSSSSMSSSSSTLRGSSISRIDTVPRTPKVPPPSTRAHSRGGRPPNQQY